MTVQAQLDIDSQNFEYILCIEGVGWGDTSSGFVGDVFVSADIAGTLAADLNSPTIHKTLQLPRSITDNLDPKNVAYDQGGMVFQIVDDETTFLTTKFKQHITNGTESVTDTNAIAWNDTTLRIADGTGFADGDVVWVGGREAILLAGKALQGGTIYNYSGVTRGYLGTDRGRLAPLATVYGAMSWPPGTSVFGHNRFWHNRRVKLWAHVPGESYTGCVLLYSGRLRGDRIKDRGNYLEFISVSDDGAVVQIRKGATKNYVASDTTVWTIKGSMFHSLHTEAPSAAQSRYWAKKHLLHIRRGDNSGINDAFALFYSLYNYRRVAGGTDGAVTAWHSTHGTQPQAVIDSDGLYRCDALVTIGGDPARVEYKREDASAENVVATRNISGGAELGDFSLFETGAPVRYMLDNVSDDATKNRFAIDNVVQRDVMRTALMLLAGMNGEFFVADAASGAANGSTVVFTAPGFTADQWDGYWLYCSEGSNLGYIREIASNTATTVTLVDSFPSQATAGNEYQIRNSRYDCLPMGWNMCIHHDDIDIEEFERIQDTHLSGVKVGQFALGEDDRTDLIAFVKEKILKPFGVVLINDRTTGKMTPRYIGELLGDGVAINYVTVGASDIIEMGDIDRAAQSPMGKVEMIVRTVESRTVVIPISMLMVEATTHRIADVANSAQTNTIEIIADELKSVFHDLELDVHSVDATILSKDDPGVAFLTSLLLWKLNRYSNPPPTVSLKLTDEFSLTVQAGTVLLITDTTKRKPYSPYDGSEGWTAQGAIVLSSEVVLEGEQGLRCTVQLLPIVSAAVISSAATVTGSGAFGGNGYFEVNDNDFTVDDTKNDWDEFVAGDYIQHRTEDGLGLTDYTIDSIDSVSSPTRIYVGAAAIADGVTAGDFISYHDWDGTQTTSMENFSAYANVAGIIGGVNQAKEYA